MKLTKICASNFKGATFCYDLTPVTVFVGRNFRGKTRIIDAVIVALLGYHPALGKEAKSTFGLSSGKDMEVCATFDNGQVIRRRFYLKGDTVKREEDVPESFAGAEQLAVLLDASKYFALGDRARIDYVFAHCPAADMFTVDAIRARFYAIAGDKGAAVAADIWKGASTVTNPQAFIDSCIEVTQALWKQAKAQAERMEKTIQGMSDLRAQDEQQTPLASLEDARARLAREITDVSERRAVLLASYTPMVAARHRREEIDREVRYAYKSQQELVDAKHKQALVVGELEDAPAVPQEKLQTLWTEVSRCKSLVDQLTVEADRQRKAKERAEGLLGSLDKQTVCPYCGAAGEGWKKLNAAELAKGIDEAGELMAAAFAQRERSQKDLDAALEAHGEAVQAQKRRQQVEQTQREVLAVIAKIEPSIARLNAMEDEAKRLPEDSPQLTADVETLQSELNVKNDEARRLDGQIKTGQGRKLELQRLADAEKQRDEARADQEVAKAVGTELRVVQSEMVAAAFAPLLATANTFFGGVLRGKLAYNSAEGGEIGMWVDGMWISHHTFSGTERALCFAAIQMALSAGCPLRLMLIDELGRLDNPSLFGVLAAIEVAVKDGRLDNFIGIDVVTKVFADGADESRLTTGSLGELTKRACSVIEIK